MTPGTLSLGLRRVGSVRQRTFAAGTGVAVKKYTHAVREEGGSLGLGEVLAPGLAQQRQRHVRAQARALPKIGTGRAVRKKGKGQKNAHVRVTEFF